jgi:hypothetical protein
MDLAPDGKAAVLHAAMTVFDPRKVHQQCASSSEEERLCDMQEADGSLPSKRTIMHVSPTGEGHG